MSRHVEFMNVCFIENHAQLIRFVARGAMKSDEAAKLAMDHAEALDIECRRRTGLEGDRIARLKKALWDIRGYTRGDKRTPEEEIAHVRNVARAALLEEGEAV